jgi:hypothetical protein
MPHAKFISRLTALAVIVSVCSLSPRPSAADGLGSFKDGSFKDSCGCANLAGPVQGIFYSYRDGGPEFAERLTDLVVADPSLARDVICAASGRGGEIVIQAARALAMAQLYLARREPRFGDQIGIWLNCADGAFQAAYYSAQMNGKLTHILIPYVPDGPGGGVVSPNKP